MERPSLRRQLVMIFLGIAIPIGILLGLLLFFSGLYNRNRLAAAASGGLDMFSIRIDVIQNSFDEWIILLLENDFLLREIRKHDIINNMKMQYMWAE